MGQREDTRRAGEAGCDGASTDAAPPGRAAPVKVPHDGESHSGKSPVAAAPGAAEPGGEEPHAARIVVWDTPPAVERGAPFSVRVGVACPAGCRPADWTVEVHGHDGELRAAAALGDDPWPGSEALHHAEIALAAPDAEGFYTWQAVARKAAAAGVHAGGGASFGVRVTAPPACVLTVVARDERNRTPVAGAQVVAHPYRAVTDGRGVAQLRIPAGAYRLFVSGKGYVPFRVDETVQADTDTTIRAELTRDVELTDADIWS